MYFILIEFNSQDCGELLGKTVCNEIVFVFEIKITSLEIRQGINLHFMFSINDASKCVCYIDARTNHIMYK